MKISIIDYYYRRDVEEARFSNSCLNTQMSNELLNFWGGGVGYYWTPKFNPETHEWNTVDEKVYKK